ncbi:MAG TPA: dihydropteroate synthase [Flavisolibacter sp.]|jgi:dihydropteroate synthase|nr:dihydropteroate synthase [Flavisolibacter sp.]
MFTLNCKGKLLVLDQPVVMGIINSTPDSFYSGSRSHLEAACLSRAETMLKQGAAIIDLGGQSTRPGSQRVPVEEELKRVIPLMAALSREFPEALLSIDTFYAEVAEEAVSAGASIINDVSAGSLDPELLNTVARLQVPYVLMHMKGDPQHMQDHPVYQNVVTEVYDYLNDRLTLLQQSGIRDIIIDPGFGFGKTIAHNFQLLKGLPVFSNLQRPVMVGLSRKGTVYKTLNTTAEQALNGTSVVHTLAVLGGASILRAHDVREAREVIELVSAYAQ